MVLVSFVPYGSELDLDIDTGGDLLGVLALVDREEGGREAIEKDGLRVISIARASEIVPRMHC